ncbi:MAG: SusE domain-containing protein [Bacteroidota bacterium]|nr:SusE domain-containing protein [Bacteroidota bacterium]MDP4204522.1 SusE domain-containing protein [Bacteroidota bacterium]
MKKLAILFWCVLCILFTNSCTQEIGDHTVHGEQISKFSLLSPDATTTVNINLGIPTKTFPFKWDAASSGLGSAITYTIVFDKVGGDFTNPIFTKQADNKGAANAATLTYNELATIVTRIKQANDKQVQVAWTVKADNGSKNITYAQPSSTLTLTVPDEGINDFKLITPAQSGSILVDAIVSPTASQTFKWNKTASTKAGSIIKYQFILDKINGDFSQPLLTMDSNNSGADTIFSMTNKDLKDLLKSKNIVAGAYQWSVKAYTDKYSYIPMPNKIFIDIFSVDVLYLVGDATDAGWDPSKGVIMTKVGDGKFTGVATLKSVADGGTYGWKVIAGTTWSAPNWGTKSGQEGTLYNGDGGINIPSPAETGIYKIDVDFTTMTYTVTKDLPQLYLVGGATGAGWDTSKALKMSKVSVGKFAIITDLDPAGGAYKFLLNNGNNTWQPQWGGNDVLGGDLLSATSAGDPPAIPAPALKGTYRIEVDFATMKYTVTPWSLDNLYMVGGSCSAGWTPANGLKFNNLGNGLFEIYEYLTTAGYGIKFLPSQAGWDGGFGMKDGSPGTLISGGEQNVPVPTDGFYRIRVDMAAMTYEVLPTTWAIIGSATPGGWSTETPMTFTGGLGSHEWNITFTATDGELKFRANNGWDINFGSDNTDGTLQPGGKNIPITAGSHTITLHLGPNGYTYTIL